MAQTSLPEQRMTALRGAGSSKCSSPDLGELKMMCNYIFRGRGEGGRKKKASSKLWPLEHRLRKQGNTHTDRSKKVKYKSVQQNLLSIPVPPHLAGRQYGPLYVSFSEAPGALTCCALLTHYQINFFKKKYTKTVYICDTLVQAHFK